MSKRTFVLPLLIAGLLPLPADACLGTPRAPLDEDVENFPTILQVTATGVHLSRFEEYVLQQRGVGEKCGAGQEPLSEAAELECIHVTSSTPDFEVRALVDLTYKGVHAPTVEFTLGGCNVREPALRAHGIVFIDPATGEAKAVWDSQDEGEYRRWQDQLDARFGAPLTDPAAEDPSETTSHAPVNR